MITVPEDWPVQPDPNGNATCGKCGRTWDDTVSTSMTPTPAGRCPFEPFHGRPVTVTIVTGPLGDLHVHKVGCRDLRKAHYAGGHPMTEEHDSVRTLVESFYGPEAGGFYAEAGIVYRDVLRFRSASGARVSQPPL